MTHHWTNLQHKSLIKDYPETPSKIIAQRLGVSVYAVYNQAFLLGLKKSKKHLAENCLMICPGVETRFKKSA